jgi:hypothetical protein
MDDEMQPLPSLYLEMIPRGLGRPSSSLRRLDVTTHVAFMMVYLHYIICKGYLRGQPHLNYDYLTFSLNYVDKCVRFASYKEASTWIFHSSSLSLTLVWGNTSKDSLFLVSLAFFSHVLGLEEVLCGCLALLDG